MKVAENTGAMITMYLAGYIKQEFDSYVGVHVLFALITLIATALAYHNWLRLNKNSDHDPKQSNKPNFSEKSHDSSIISEESDEDEGKSLKP